MREQNRHKSGDSRGEHEAHGPDPSAIELPPQPSERRPRDCRDRAAESGQQEHAVAVSVRKDVSQSACNHDPTEGDEEELHAQATKPTRLVASEPISM